MKYNQNQLQQLDKELAENIEELFSELKVDYQHNWKRYYGVCPCHNSDNGQAWNLYTEGHTRPYWNCWTRKCERKFNSSIVGFCRGRRSYQRGNIEHFQETLKFILSFLGYKNINQIKTPTKEELKRQQQINMAYNLCAGNSVGQSGKWSIKQVRNQLEIPAQYFIKRGFSPEILDRYHVGYLDSQKRVICPILDNSGKFCVGFTKRSIYNRCRECECYHNPSSSCLTNKFAYSKWTNSSGFENRYSLYNLWNASPHIKRTNTAVVVEGCPDIWRLVEAGIHNGVGLFGTDLSEPQLALLDANCVLNLVIILDNDEAGIEGRKRIHEMVKRTHRVLHYGVENDVGSTDKKELRKLLKDFIK